MAEFQIVQSPTRTGDRVHSDVPGYAKGLWTPSIGGTAAYTYNVGRYTRIGNRVFITCDIAVSSLGTGSTTDISGLPFPATENSFANQYILAARVNNAATAIVYVVGVIDGGTSVIKLFSRTGANIDDAQNAIFGTAAVVITGSYEVDL